MICFVSIDGGAIAAAQGFLAEDNLNSGFRVANDALDAHFTMADSGGPSRCAEFMISGLEGQRDKADHAFRKSQIREEMVGLANLLRRE